jgi:hypothetical protein
MNIFYLHSDPKVCAEWAVDKHVVKMILEAAQLLSTAHRVLDGVETTTIVTKQDSFFVKKRKVKQWVLPDHRNTEFYKATHINHPCAIWARESNNNYNWLWSYLYEHCKEYTRRYGKVHKIEREGLLMALSQPPRNIPISHFFQPPSAMDAKYIISGDSRVNYCNYYKKGKAHLHSWKAPALPPSWIME